MRRNVDCSVRAKRTPSCPLAGEQGDETERRVLVLLTEARIHASLYAILDVTKHVLRASFSHVDRAHLVR